MSVELHCTHCGKLIRAPEGAGGRWGKCPYCKESVYIPLEPSEGDELTLAPVDESEERRLEALRRESIKYAADVDKDAGPAYPAAADKQRADASGIWGPGGRATEVVDVGDEVRKFVLAMRDSKLEEAERIANRLKKNEARARDYIQGLLVDQMAPRIEGLPAGLQNGFLNELLKRLS